MIDAIEISCIAETLSTLYFEKSDLFLLDQVQVKSILSFATTLLEGTLDCLEKVSQSW